MEEKELEKKLYDLQFQIDLLDEKLNQWIKKFKEHLGSSKLINTINESIEADEV